MDEFPYQNVCLEKRRASSQRQHSSDKPVRTQHHTHLNRNWVGTPGPSAAVTATLGGDACVQEGGSCCCRPQILSPHH